MRGNVQSCDHATTTPDPCNELLRLGRRFEVAQRQLRHHVRSPQDLDQLAEKETNPLLDVLYDIACRVGDLKAQTSTELVVKAKLLLEFVGPDGDTVNVLTHSLCQDIVAMHP